MSVLKTNIVTSVSQLSRIISELQTIRGINSTLGNLNFEMYRGQENEAWKLEPNICRNVKNHMELKRIEREMVIEFHNELVKSCKTKRIQNGFLKGHYHGDWLLIQQAQHYELPTRFMDWTIKWEVALHFAVSNPKHDNFNGELWIYMVPNDKLLIDNENAIYRNEDPFSYTETMFLNSASLSSTDYLTQIAIQRKDKQQGRFLVQSYTDILIPLQENPKHATNLTKLIIPSGAKKSIRTELELRGLTEKSLYIEPDSFIKELNLTLKSKYGI